MSKTFGVPISKPTNNPVMVRVGPNVPMGAWDIQISIGNFKTESEAREVGVKLAKMMEREIGVKGGVVR